MQRLASEGRLNAGAVWARDGQLVTFVSSRRGNAELWTQRVDGGGAAVLEVDRGAPIYEVTTSRDGTSLAFREGAGASNDIYGMRRGRDTVPVPVLATAFSEHAPALSPDGRWLAYVSDQNDREDVFVRAFLDDGAVLRQVSPDGGSEPKWAHSGRQLFYRNNRNELVSVSVVTDPAFTTGVQTVLFSMNDYVTFAYGRTSYDVGPDDQQFVMLRKTGEEGAGSELILVENFVEELKRLAPN